MPVRETIRPIPPLESEIIKETYKDGKVRYFHPVQVEIDTCHEQLYDFFEKMLSSFQDLVNFMDDNEYDRFGHLFQTILNDSFYRLHEAFEFIEKTIGIISVCIVARGETCYRNGRVVGTELRKPCKMEGGPGNG